MVKTIPWAVVLGLGGTLLAASTLGACSFEGLSTAETDVVLTFEDEKRDYSAYKTYALTDQIIDLCEVAGEDGTLPPFGGAGGGISVGDCFELKHVHDADVLGAIDRNMKAMGYTKVKSVDDKPDVTLLVAAVTRNQWYYAPGYWWCDPYYYYYCWYPSVGYVYSLPLGSVLINMVDNNETDGNHLSSAWFAAFSGLYQRADDKTGKERIDDAVDKAFTQSPYLEVK